MLLDSQILVKDHISLGFVGFHDNSIRECITLAGSNQYFYLRSLLKTLKDRVNQFCAAS